MRDPKRIPRILALLEKYWTAHPDLRLTQIVVNAADAQKRIVLSDDELRIELDRRQATSAFKCWHDGREPASKEEFYAWVQSVEAKRLPWSDLTVHSCVDPFHVEDDRIEERLQEALKDEG